VPLLAGKKLASSRLCRMRRLDEPWLARNQLGPSERPALKKGRREKEQRDWDDVYQFDDDNWASVVDNDADERLLARENEGDEKGKGVKVKKASHFGDKSDEDFCSMQELLLLNFAICLVLYC